MKDYFVEFTWGDSEYFNAKNDESAIKKAQKMGRKMGVGVWYLAEWFDIKEDDRLIIYKGKRV